MHAGTGGTNGKWVALLLVFCVPVALYAFGFPFFNVGHPDIRAHLVSLPVYAWLHFLGGGVALLVGGFQFSTAIRSRRPALHRMIGRVYLIAVLLAGVGGLAIATASIGGIPSHVGFGMLALLWLASGVAAWRAIRRRDIAAHQRWMMRNFALTLTAVTLRIELGVLTGLVGLPFNEAYVTVSWLAWVPNLIVVELLIERMRARAA